MSPAKKLKLEQLQVWYCTLYRSTPRRHYEALLLAECLDPHTPSIVHVTGMVRRGAPGTLASQSSAGDYSVVNYRRERAREIYQILPVRAPHFISGLQSFHVETD